MSGHSKWHKIKHTKESTDKKKGQIFGKLAKEIVSVARHEKDPAKNAALREVIARAKKANMPQANIDRLLQGKDDSALQTVAYEGFGPGGVALIINAITDNPNRTVAEMRMLLKNNGGILGEIGSVRWKFKPAATFSIPVTDAIKTNLEDIELSVIDAGADDVLIQENELVITTPPEQKESVEKVLQQLVGDTTSTLILTPLQLQSVSADEEAQLKLLLDLLHNHQDVESVVTDWDNKNTK